MLMKRQSRTANKFIARSLRGLQRAIVQTDAGVALQSGGGAVAAKMIKQIAKARVPKELKELHLTDWKRILAWHLAAAERNRLKRDLTIREEKAIVRKIDSDANKLLKN